MKEQEVSPATKKVNRHIVVALSHLNKRKDALIAQRENLTAEIEEIGAAILALE